MSYSVGIVDYGAGNIGSIHNMIKRLGGDSYLVKDPYSLIDAERLILPGVGNFDHGMKMLLESNLFDSIKEYINLKQRPLLGICLGAQLLTKRSEEGELEGFGFFDAEVLHFSKLPNVEKIRIPHMGWSHIQFDNDKKLFKNLPSSPRFYFVHSYYLHSNVDSEILCTAKYKSPFVAGLQKANVWAVQFHPEKSHKYGMQIFQNFLKL